jgi:hypothetical protein
MFCVFIRYKNIDLLKMPAVYPVNRYKTGLIG